MEENNNDNCSSRPAPIIFLRLCFLFHVLFFTLPNLPSLAQCEQGPSVQSTVTWNFETFLIPLSEPKQDQDQESEFRGKHYRLHKYTMYL